MSRSRTREHIAEDRRHPGTQRPLVRDVPVDLLGSLATSTAAVPADGIVHLDATVEASGLDVVVTGEVDFPWEGECRRCLKDVTGRLATSVREVFTPDAVEGETWPVEGDAIDLGPVLHDAVLLSLPLVPLCSTECRGPDPDRFPATVEGEETSEVGRDPRWAALDSLTFDAPDSGSR